MGSLALAPSRSGMTTADSVSTDSGISSAISEEEGDNSNAVKDKDSDASEKADAGKQSRGESQNHPMLKLEKPKLYNSKSKSSFEGLKKIALLIEKAVRQRKVFCLGGKPFSCSKKSVVKEGVD